LAAPVIGAETQTVSLEEAYLMAIATHEAVKTAGERVSQAESNVDKALSIVLPQISLEGGYTRYNEQKASSSGILTQPDDSSRLDVKLTQPLYMGGTAASARRQARMVMQRSKEGVTAAREEVMQGAASAYFGVLKAGKEAEIKKAALKRAHERGRVASTNFKAGMVTKSAVLRAEAETAAKEADFIHAEAGLKDAENRLKRVIGVTGGIRTVLPGPQPVIPEDADELLKTAYARRLDYRQSVLDRNIAEESITYAKGNFLPRLRAEGQYSLKGQNPKTTFFQEDSVSASVILSYPIFEGGLRKAELSESRSRLREADIRRQGLKKDIEIEVREALNAVESARAMTESYKKRLSFAEEDYKMVFEQFRFGLATTVDVIDADTELVSAASSLINSTFDLQLAIIGLKYRIGVLSDDAGKGEER
ncbi:MAG: TolC family protein, partial [Deltaproteobacteria bacterium]|nr:TolC family protein [Deltaproteobacteria bacterium]